jgi:AAA domain
MRGAAGTGKTEVIVKWLNSMLDKSISRDDVLVGASNANAAVGVNKSFPSTKGGLEFDKFMEELELAIKENRSYSLILFDEVGALNIHQLTRFVDATKEMRKINPNVKVLVLGDPNQLVTDDTGIPSIELKFGTASIPGLPFIQQIDPLTIRYRSDNSAVVNIQDGFIRKIQRVKDLVGKMNKGPKEILTNEDPLFGSYIEETTGQLLTVLKNNIETSPTRERAIIVSTEAQKKSWQSKLSTALGATHTVKVYTINEAQGMSIPEVYVDMQYDPSIYPQIATYNKAMYTATSRARDFLYVGNVPGGSTVSDPNMLEVMQQLAESKKLGYDMAIANLEKQKRYRDMFFDEGIPPTASGSKPSPPAPGAAPTSAGGGGTTATPGKSSTTTSPTSSTAEAGATSSTSTEESGDYIEDGIIQTNGPLVETVDNITYGTANKQREPDRENEDALFVNVKSGRFAITDGMGGEGSVTMSPAEAARFTIGWLFGKMKKTLNDLLYEEYLRNPAITTEEAIDFLNKNGRSISKTSALSTAVTRIINTFKTKGSISGLKGLRAGATGIKAIKEGPNLYKITKMGDTVYFVVDKDGNIRKKHGMSTEATTDGVIYSIVDGKPSIYSPPVHTVTIQLKEGETLVLASDFIETEEAAYDFIDTDYGININFAKFQMKNKRDDSTFIVIRHDGTIVAPGGKSTTTAAPTDATKPEDTTEDSTAEDTTTDEETTKPPGDTIIHEDPDEEEPLGDSMSVEEEVEDVVDEGDTTEIEDELPISKGKTKGLFETIVDGIKATNSNLKKIFTKSNLLDKKDIHSDNATFYPMMFELPNGTLGSFEGLRREFDKAQLATGGRSLEMMAIKIRTDLTDASKFHYAIVYRIPSTDTKNMYFAKVAVLSQKGYERLPDGYKDMPARVVKDVGRTRKTLDSIISIAGNTLSPEEEASKFIMTDTEDHPSTALAVKFKPSDSPPSRLTGTKLNGILKKIASAGFTVDKSKVEIRVFDERGLTAMYKKYPKIATNLSPGMSYLIVPTKESPETPIVIRLTPSKLNNDNYGPELKLINSYIDKVEKFQKMTKTMTKKGILSKPLVLGSDSDFAKLISAMSNIYQHLVPNESGKLRPLGKSITLNQVTTEHPFYGELLKLMFDGGGVVPNTNKDGDDVFDTTLFETTYKPLFELAYEIDTAIHGERVSKRNHRGEVQAAFDKIARSNLVWFPTDSSNDMIILRDQRIGYKQTPGGK